MVRYGRRRNQRFRPPDQRVVQQYQQQRPRYQRVSYADVTRRAPDRRGGPRWRNNGGQNNRYAARPADRGTRRQPPRPRTLAPLLQRPNNNNNNNNRTFNNNNRHDTFQSNEGTSNLPRSDDPLFSNKCRILHRIIKASHHFTNIDVTNPPISIVRMTTQLAAFIKPAIPTAETQTLIDGNAKNWEHTALIILQDHYEAVIKRGIESLHSLNSPDWSAPFDVASAWARRDFGRRLHPETLKEAKEVVEEWMAVLLIEDPQPAPAVSVPPVVVTQTNPVVHPLRRVRPGDAAEPRATPVVHTAEAQVSPEPRRPAPAATRTVVARALPELSQPTAAEAQAPGANAVHVVEAQVLPEPRVAELVSPTPPPPVAAPQRPRPSPNNIMDSPIEVHFELGTLSPSTPRSTVSSQWAIPPALSTQRSLPLPQRPQRLFVNEPESPPGSRAAAAAESSTAASPAPSSVAAASPTAAAPRPRGWVPYHNPCAVHHDDAVEELSQENLRRLVQQEPDRPLSRLQEDLRRVPLTPSSTSRLRSAVQSQLIQTGTTSVSNLRTPGQQVPLRPTKHRSTIRKAQEWSLHVAKKWLILGDSNVAKLPEHDFVHLQIDAFPGATFRNAELLMDKTTCGVTVEKVILAFGINNRVQKTQETALKQLQRALNSVKRMFPSADIFVPQVNFSNSLPSKEKLRLTHLNSAIARLCEYIPALPPSLFHTGPDNIHWSPSTAVRMFDHWVRYLN